MLSNRTALSLIFNKCDTVTQLHCLWDRCGGRIKRYNCITKQSNPFVPEVSITESEKQTYETKSLSAVSEHDTTESVSLIIAKSESDVNASDTPKFTEQAFFEWLVSDGGVSESTAKQYISNIHNIIIARFISMLKQRALHHILRELSKRLCIVL